MKIEPHFHATITLYPTKEGGKKLTMHGADYRCPCKFHPEDLTGWDAAILLGGASFAPGETKQFGMRFLTPEAGALFRIYPKFFLWEGRVFGEAVPMLSSD